MPANPPTPGEFLRELFGDLEPDEYIELRALGGISGSEWFRDPEELAEAARRQKEGENLYFGVHPRRGMKRDGASVSRMTSFHADLDFSHAERSVLEKRIREFRVRPTAVAESGHGLHAYWLFHEPEALDKGDYESLQRGIQAALGADKTHDLARILRLPGTLNWKYDPPVPCRVIFADFSRRYSASDFETFRDVGNGNGNGAGPAPPVGDRIPTGARDKTLASLAGSMRRRGMSPDAILAALRIENMRCEPPLPESDLKRIAASIGRYPPDPAACAPVEPEPPKPEAVPERFNLTDVGNCRRMVKQHGVNLRFCRELGWLVWDGRRWAEDTTGEVNRRAKATAVSILEEASRESDPDRRKTLAKHALASETGGRINAMVSLAESELEVVARFSDLDKDDWLLNVENGTLDLRTGTLREHRREDLITKLAPVPYIPDAPAAAWDKFLDDITKSRPGLKRFLQCFAGYALTGSTREQCVAILFGTGSNGKSVFLRVISALLGDYARATSAELLLAKRDPGIPENIARLQGARLVTAVEAEQERRLAEGLVKAVSGGDRIQARYLYRNSFEFEPKFKLVLATNHRPRIRGTDHAIWRRIRLVPFDVQIPKELQDPDLADKLLDELPGILAWAVRGCLDWRQHRLPESEEVNEATRNYRQEEDLLAGFIEDCCTVGPDLEATSKALFEAYLAWCEGNGDRPVSAKAFSLALQERGHARIRERFQPGGKLERGHSGITLCDRSGAVTDRDSYSQESIRGNLNRKSYRNTGHNMSRVTGCVTDDLEDLPF